MPIINLCNATDTGAEGQHYAAGYSDYIVPTDRREALERIEKQGPYCVWIRLSHVGLCLRDYERNGYDDSDFHMIVWNPERNEPEDICFASTRGWSYPCYGSKPDATPEVQERYALYLDGIERLRLMAQRSKRAADRCQFRAEMRAAAKGFGFSYVRLLKAQKEWSTETRAKIMRLLTSKIRSGFKLSLRQQVVNWLNEASPRYRTPLTPKQLDYLPV